MSSALLSHAEPVWLAIAPYLPGVTVEVLPSIDSTNSELMRRTRAGRCEPVLLVAEDQTAGRGRVGKAWHSKPGQSLTFSLGLPLSPANWSGLSLAVGVSLAESLDPQVRLKWPNDLWWHQRKLGGILVETASSSAVDAPRTLVVGVGLNVNRPDTTALVASHGPSGAMPPVPAAGVAEFLVGITAGELLERVVPALVRDIKLFEALGFDAFASRFEVRDALFGQPVLLSDGTQGVADGVGPQGGLKVRTDGGWREVTSAEVSVRPC
jgi:BirA family transcriptional regulator, biotin operon repressor / biotin---[acetyl-CoA-carboxylase] ligase